MSVVNAAPSTTSTRPHTRARTSGSVTVGRIITGFITVFLAFDAVTHLSRVSAAVEFNDKIGAPDWFPVLCGAVMAALLVLHLVPRTAVIGAVGIAAYLGGATAVNIVTEQPAFNVAFAIGTGLLVWAGLLMRDERARNLI